MTDNVNQPAHYTRFPIQPIRLTQHLNFCRGNAVKYLARAGHKDGVDELEDLRKARYYILQEIQRVEEQREQEGHGEH